MKIKIALILLLSLIVIAQISYIAGSYVSPVEITISSVIGYLPQSEWDKVSVGDIVKVVLMPSFNGNGIVKTVDKNTKMATIEIKNTSGSLVLLTVHVGWTDSIVTDIPEVVDDIALLKQQVINLQTENSTLKATISSQKTYIDKVKVDMQNIRNISANY